MSGKRLEPEVIIDQAQVCLKCKLAECNENNPDCLWQQLYGAREKRRQYEREYLETHREQHNVRSRAWHRNMTPEQRAHYRERQREYDRYRVQNRTPAQRADRAEKRRAWYAGLSAEQKAAICQRQRELRREKKKRNGG